MNVFSLTFHPTFLDFNWIGSYSYFNLLKILVNFDLLGMVLVMFRLFTGYVKKKLRQWIFPILAVPEGENFFRGPEVAA